MQKCKIYFISGLGADRRAFSRLKFPAQFDLVYLDWIPALHNESLVDYAGRLSLNIDTSAPFYLVGLSFGGMLATEIAKKLNPVHTFLISSISVFKELPWYYRASGTLNLQKLVPLDLMKKGNNIGLRFLGAKTKDEKALLKQLVIDSDPVFMKWALTAILKWRNTERPANITQVHGTTDNILPHKYTKPDILIEGGGHFMVHANAPEIMERLVSILFR
ncbi:MAG TPA: alpha/beta hydrolase [Pedobacter sp.]|uniref:alpha/beta hydrolase n=1 Tax=Pedobacter sp. TaxID=1411316 RepID=UPI002C34582E|nr:alpha/beta hydrolase [Pedobacter sp.]HMI02680.1 alpha/beta hydrolase [Pedobacter sp.]